MNTPTEKWNPPKKKMNLIMTREETKQHNQPKTMNKVIQMKPLKKKLTRRNQYQ